MIFIRTARLFRTIDRTQFIAKKRSYRVLISGGAGGVGQACALLLKQNDLVTSLVLHDLSKSTPQIARDLDILDMPGSTEGYTGSEIEKAYKGADLVLITAGFSAPQLNLLKYNAPVVFGIAKNIVKYCPKAIVGIVTNPIDQVVPIACEIMMRNKAFDPNKIFGVTSLHLTHAQLMAAQLLGNKPEKQFVPVVGGNDASTLVPLWSQSRPDIGCQSQQYLDLLTKRLQTIDMDVESLKTSGPTLSIAYAATGFVNNILRGLDGEEDIVDYSYVYSNVTASPYFSSPLLLGKGGIECFLPIGNITYSEQLQMEKVIPILMCRVQEGVAYVNTNYKECTVF